MQEDATNDKKESGEMNMDAIRDYVKRMKKKQKTALLMINGTMANSLNGELKCWQEHIHGLFYIPENKQNITIYTIAEETWAK